MGLRVYVCKCGKVCTTKAGVVLHHKFCRYKSHVEEMIQQNVHGELSDELKELIDLAEYVAVDANDAFKNNNISAARRARVGLLKIRNMILPIRKSLLEKVMKK